MTPKKIPANKRERKAEQSKSWLKAYYYRSEWMARYARHTMKQIVLLRRPIDFVA